MGNKKEGPFSPLARCAPLPVTEANFALLRQFSVSVSSIVILVVFGGFMSNTASHGGLDKMSNCQEISAVTASLGEAICLASVLLMLSGARVF